MAAALLARELNVLLLLTAYQAKLHEDFVRTQDPESYMGGDNTDLHFRMQCCALQATGKALETMVLQERAL